MDHNTCCLSFHVFNATVFVNCRTRLSTIKDELHMDSPLDAVLVLSTFVLTYCLGPLILGPLSEIFGRAAVLHSGNSFYLIFNLVCGFARNKGELLASRLLSGIGGGGGLVVGADIISDCFRKEERGWVISIYNLGLVFGPSLGAVTWRWAFWATSIFDEALIVLGLLVMEETYPPVILARRKAKMLKTASTNSPLLKTPYEKPDQTVGQLYRNSLLRPLHLLRVQPIVQFLAIFYAYLYGLMYLVCGFLADPIYRVLKKKHGEIGKPEFRVVLMFPASVLAPVGLLWYGWGAQAVTHWIVPDLGIGLFAGAAMILFQCTSAYLYEAFTLYAASATGAVYILRGLTGFGFPLFGPRMYQSLGYGWGTTMLALVAVVMAARYLLFFGDMVSDLEIGVVMRLDKVWMA
ncbi:hypothetical protein N7465_005021 [Penicillium sp. CMV-2018d]|nr:hypothetical protein N7465_005021 [Penicillium sp. CMV-2018d]